MALILIDIADAAEQRAAEQREHGRQGTAAQARRRARKRKAERRRAKDARRPAPKTILIKKSRQTREDAP